MPIGSTHELTGNPLNLAGAAARGGAATLAGQFMRAAVQFVAIAILARLISPEDFGLVAMSVAVVGVAAIFSDFGLSIAAIQSQTITQQQRSNLFWTNTLIGLVLAGIVYAAAPLLGAFYAEPAVTSITGALAITFLLMSVGAQFRAELTVKLRFAWLAATDVIPAVVALVVAVVIAMQGAGVWALVAQQIVIAALTLALLIVGARWVPGLPRRGQSMRALYTFGANTFGVQLLNYATSNLDSILIGRVWGAGSLGVYDRAFRVFRIPLQQIAAPMSKVALPILSRLQSDPRYDAYLQRAQLVLGYFFSGSFLVLAGLSDPLIEIMLGTGWDEAKPIFGILAIGGVFQGIGYVYAWVFQSRALTGLQLRWTAITRLATMALMVVGVAWGPIGVAIACAIGQALNWLILTLFPMKRTGIRRVPLILVALRPIVFLLPLALATGILSYFVLIGIPPMLELLMLLGLVIGYIACGSAVPRIRKDYRDLWDTIRRVRRSK